MSYPRNNISPVRVVCMKNLVYRLDPCNKLLKERGLIIRVPIN